MRLKSSRLGSFVVFKSTFSRSTSRTVILFQNSVEPSLLSENILMISPYVFRILGSPQIAVKKLSESIFSCSFSKTDSLKLRLSRLLFYD